MATPTCSIHAAANRMSPTQILRAINTHYTGCMLSAISIFTVLRVGERYEYTILSFCSITTLQHVAVRFLALDSVNNFQLEPTVW